MTKFISTNSSLTLKKKAINTLTATTDYSKSEKISKTIINLTSKFYTAIIDKFTFTANTFQTITPTNE